MKPIPNPVREMVQEMIDAHLPEPTALLPTFGVVHRDFSDPVDHSQCRSARLGWEME